MLMGVSAQSSGSGEIERLVSLYLDPQEQTGDFDEDLAAAGRAAWRIRHANTVNGGEVISMLRRRGFSWPQIKKMTGIPISTAQRWAVPPVRSDET